MTIILMPNIYEKGLLIMPRQKGKNCKYCADSNTKVFPTKTQDLRCSTRMTHNVMAGNAMQAMDDSEFAKILNTKHCCMPSQFDAEDAYHEFFPYHGLQKQEYYIGVLKSAVDGLSDSLKDLTTEKYSALEDARGNGEDNEGESISEKFESIEFYYKKLEKLRINTTAALERETNPVRRKLLDGRTR